MSDFKHTPGPWRFKIPVGRQGTFTIEGELNGTNGASLVCEMPYSAMRPSGASRAEGDARLIATAPRMLAIIEAVADGVSVATARLLARDFLADLRKDSAP